MQTDIVSEPVRLYYLETDDVGEVTVNLPKGTYLLMLHRSFGSSKFLAYCYITITWSVIVDIDVRPFVAPVTLEAIKPLKDREFSYDAYYYLFDQIYDWVWGFDIDEPGMAVVYLPLNIKFNAVYRDWGSQYLLYKANIQARGTSTKIQFDASKTGFIQPEFILPASSSGYGNYYNYFYITINDWWFYIWDSYAVSAGSYPAIGEVIFESYEEPIYHDWTYTFDLGKITVAAKTTRNVKFGGELVMTAKPNKSSYKPGESIQIEYSVKDQFKHNLYSSYKHDWNEDTNEHSYPEWTISATISDKSGILGENSWQDGWFGGTRYYSLYHTQYATSNNYIFAITWDTEVYQGEVSGSCKFSIKSSLKIPNVEYFHLSGATIRIGVLASDTEDYATLEPFIREIVKPDVNDYYNSLGYNINFEFEVADAEAQAPIFLEKVMDFHNGGVDLILGDSWSSMAYASLQYLNENNMLHISSTSTSPLLEIANDRLFRFAPAYSWYSYALVDMLWSRGIRCAIIMQRGDNSFGDIVVNKFKELWSAKGGKLAGDTIRYDMETVDFTIYLEEAEAQAASALTKYPNKVGMMLVSFEEERIAVQAEGYNNLYNNIKWYGAAFANSQAIINYAGPQAVKMGFYSPEFAEPDTPEYKALAERYSDLTSEPFTMWRAFMYDSAFALAETIVSIESMDPSIIAANLPNICSKYNGVSGNCALNQYGDRLPIPYDIWSYKYISGSSGPVEAVIVGYGIPKTHSVTWYIP